MTESGDADAQGAARGVATDQRHIVLRRQLEQTVGQPRHKSFIGLRQTQIEQEPQRLCAHGGQVTEIHRQGLPADIRGRRAHREMASFDQGVGAQGQLAPGRRLDQCGVIANTQSAPCRCRFALKVLPNQLEFGHRA